MSIPEVVRSAGFRVCAAVLALMSPGVLAVSVSPETYTTTDSSGGL
jgi:hypothetical protein